MAVLGAVAGVACGDRAGVPDVVFLPTRFAIVLLIDCALLTLLTSHLTPVLMALPTKLTEWEFSEPHQTPLHFINKRLHPRTVTFVQQPLLLPYLRTFSAKAEPGSR